MNQLSELISGSGRRPLILNGRLLMYNNQLVTVRRENYRVIFSQVGAGRQETILENGEDILTAAADAFNKKYGRLTGMDAASLTTFKANSDTFSGAIVMHNAAFDALMDSTYERKFHDPTQQFPPEVKALLQDFLVDLVAGYFGIYARLLNRRLMVSHMPIIIKGHLVSGLYQPFDVSTRFISCPLRLGEFQWLTTYMNSPVPIETILERVYETSRGLSLTAIAMSDICDKFHVPLVKEMDRLHWIFILYAAAINMVVPGGYNAVTREMPGVWNTISEGRDGTGPHAATYDFFRQFTESLRGIKNTIAVR